MTALDSIMALDSTIVLSSVDGNHARSKRVPIVVICPLAVSRHLVSSFILLSRSSISALYTICSMICFASYTLIPICSVPLVDSKNSRHSIIQLSIDELSWRI